MLTAARAVLTHLLRVALVFVCVVIGAGLGVALWGDRYLPLAFGAGCGFAAGLWCIFGEQIERLHSRLTHERGRQG